MAYNAIASGSAILTTNADGLTAGLAKASKDMDKWSRDANGRMRDASGKFVSTGAKGLTGQIAGLNGASNGALAGMGATLGTAIGGPIGAAIGGAIGSALGTAAGKAKELLGSIVDTLSDTSKQGAMAKALGLTSEQFTGMAGVAKSVGEDTREFLESLVTMGKLGTDAARGTEQASLAFQGLGLNAEEFIKLRADEQFFQIFDALGKVQDPLQRTRLLMQAFGEDGGKYLLPLLGKAPSELRQMADSLAVTTAEMEKATAASGAFKRLETLGNKLWRGLAVAAAPGLEMLADFGTSALRAVQPVLDLISAGADRVWRGMRTTLEGITAFSSRLWERIQPRVRPIFDWLDRAWETTKWLAGAAWDGIVSLVVPAVEKIVDWIADAVTAVSDWGKGVVGLTGDWAKAETFIVKAFRTIGTAGAAAWDTLRVGAGFLAIGIGKVIEYLGKLGSQYLFVVKGMVGVAAKFGIMNESLKGLEKFAEQWDKMAKDVGKDIGAWGKQMVKTGDATVKQFNRWVNALQMPWGRGRQGRLGGDFGGPEGGALGGEDETPSSWKLSEALEKGTKEAYSLVLKNQMRALYGPEDTAKKHLDVAKETKKVAEKSLDQQKRMADRLSKIGRT
ncbi:Putative tail tape measure protein OS=Vibrio phage VpKK5 PE=4 SV=1 [Gemmata massiliana]|uniref:Uncharacterized protein n=1 Tax=Gemmata massiliana TaxID=1210884 RepID=A0A6P2DL64_9BACT|nr:hypothetical protein [Gemmata massiliana]VTS03524.1 Putative tail tape measure protein OS=Vibrio phage VpKK5 PE=4 SV=1 [Gemmata massiliana]